MLSNLLHKCVEFFRSVFYCQDKDVIKIVEEPEENITEETTVMEYIDDQYHDQYDDQNNDQSNSQDDSQDNILTEVQEVNQNTQVTSMNITEIGYEKIGDEILEDNKNIEKDSEPICTEIKNNKFKNDKDLTEFTIPSQVIHIGKQAFYGCDNLKKIKITNTEMVIEIEKEVFCKRENKKLINLPNLKIYVPKKLLEEYKKDKNWKRYNDLLVSK